MAMFRVQDTGRGIPQADLPFIFNRFYRVHNDDTSKVEGNGLGLAIVKSIVDQHNGQVSVKSAPASGTCFSVSLPLASLVEPGKDLVITKPGNNARKKPARGVLV